MRRSLSRRPARPGAFSAPGLGCARTLSFPGSGAGRLVTNELSIADAVERVSSELGRPVEPVVLVRREVAGTVVNTLYFHSRYVRLSIRTLAAFAGAIALSIASFGAGALAWTSMHHDSRREASADVVREGPKTAMLDRLAARYYRPIDRARLERAPVRALGRVLDDRYTSYLSPRAYSRLEANDAGRYGGVGIHAHFASGSVVVDDVLRSGPAAAAGLRSGDVVTAVAGVPTRGRSRLAVLRRIRGDAGTAVVVRVERHGRTLVRRMVRREVVARVVFAELRWVAGVRVGYLSISEFSSGVGRQTRSALERLTAGGARVIVLDLRHDPGGFVDEAVSVVSTLLPQGSVVLRERGLHIDPLVVRTAAPPVDLETPVAVLVDGETASAAEIVTGALHDARRAVVVGRRTFGKGVIQEVDPLRSGGALKLTFAEYLTPGGYALDRRGIAPDVRATDNPARGGDTAVGAAAVAALSHASRPRTGG